MAETPEERVARLQAELAAAQADQRVAHLQAELASAQTGAAPTALGHPAPGYPSATGPAAPPVGYPPGTGAAAFVGHGPSDYADPTDPTDVPAAPGYRPPAVRGRDRHANVGSGAGPDPARHRFADAVDAPLAPPPRRVPLAFLAAAFSWRWWEAWAFFMVAIAPIALWGGIPWTGTVAGVLTLAVAAFLRLRTDWTNFVLLRRGAVADEVRVRQDNTGTYYSGVTYSNVRMAVAHGWQVEREWYSGPGTKSVLDYAVDGKPGTMTLHGLPYAGGVILADPRQPDRAKCVSQFPYDLDRDSSGNWVGAVPTRVWVGSFFTIAMWGGWALLVLYWQLAVVR